MKKTKLKIGPDSMIGRLLHAAGPFGFLAVDTSKVNLNDLLAESRPGKIVRVNGDPSTCIAVFSPAESEYLGCVAGWISEEEET